MKKYNPFKSVLDIESKVVQAKPKGIGSSIVSIVLYLILLATYQQIILNIKLKNQFAQVSIIVIVSLLFCITILMLYKKISFYNDRVFEAQNKITNKMIVYTIVMAVGFFLFTTLVLSIELKYININSYLEDNKRILSNCTVIIIYGCIIAPLCEEFIMRGIVLSGLLKTYDYRISIIISAILFGGLHLNKIQFISGIVMGILLGLLYVKYKSLILCMISHCICNISGVFIPINKDNIIICSVCSVIGLIIIISMTILLNKEDKKRKYNSNSAVYVETN